MNEDQKKWIIEILEYISPSGECNCEACQEMLSVWERGEELFAEELNERLEEETNGS